MIIHKSCFINICNPHYTPNLQPNGMQINLSAKTNLAQPNCKHANTTQPILNTTNATITIHDSISLDVQSFIHLFKYIDSPCGSTPLASSARNQLLEVDVDVNGTPSVALIDSGTSQ